jgi:transposase
MRIIGIDVHKVHSQVCVQDEQGHVMLETRIKTEAERFATVLGPWAPAKVLLESACESEWVARTLEALQLEVIVADPNYAPMYATLTKKVKTDQRDARALADACRLGAWRKAHRLSDEQRRVRQRLVVRDQLVSQRSSLISLVRSLTRAEGVRLNRGATDAFWWKTARAQWPRERLPAVAPLLHQLACLEDSIEVLDRELEVLARQDERIRRLQTVPGIGVITALGFVSIVDDHGRFESAHQVESYLGLVPSESSSGERRLRGHITKVGNSLGRRLVTQAAWAVLNCKGDEARPLIEYFERLAATRGRRIALIALARRLTGILFALLRDGTTFKPEQARTRQRGPTRQYKLRQQ